MAEGTELYDPASLNGPAEEPETKAPNLLTLPEPKAARELVGLWTRLDPLMRHRLACWEANALRREGFVNVRVVKSQDQSRYLVYPPIERRGQPQVHAFNKARVLCRTFVGNLLADPPAPIVEPTSDSDEDRDAAELSQRALEDIQSPYRLNTPTGIREALDRACSYGSGFLRYYVDPTKGGRHPKTIQASPLATDAENPLVDPQTGQPWGAIQMVPDPMTGMLVMQRGVPPDPIERFVMEDGRLTDQKSEAALEWRPGLCRDTLDGRHVRFLPWGADREKAECVLIGSYITLREARALIKGYDKVLTPEQEKALTTYRPEHGDYLLPDGKRDADNREGDEALVFCLTGVWKECADYPDGAYLMALGESYLLYRDTWVAEVGGERLALPLPVAQVKQWTNGKSDPYGDGMMDDLGGANEIRAAQVGYLMSYLDMWNNMPVFIPSTSTVTDSDLRYKRLIRTMPGQQPWGLKGPGYEDASLQLFEATGTEMDSASHLQQAAQGVEDSSVKSGRHAFQIITQVHAQLSEPKQHVELGYVQASTIELQLTRAFGLSGETRWQGEDGRYKYDRWEASNLGGDVRLKPGTMTMLSPGAKSQLLENWQASGAIAPDKAQELMAANLSATLGRLDDPYRLEIRRSLAEWEQGPPEGWQPPPPQVMLGPTGPQLMPGPDPVAQQLFPVKPHHALPLVAQLRAGEMARVMAGTKYDGMPPQWQQVLAMAFQQAQQALQPVMQPPPEGTRGEPDPGPRRSEPSAPPSPSNPPLDPVA